jgi:hypothetical protein
MAKKSATKSPAAKSDSAKGDSAKGDSAKAAKAQAAEAAPKTARKSTAKKATTVKAAAAKPAAKAAKSATAASAAKPAAKKAARKAAAPKAAAPEAAAKKTASKSRAVAKGEAPAAEAAPKTRARSASPIQAPAPVSTAVKSAPKPAAPQVVQSAQAGVIRPAMKRPALAPSINSTALYRQDRLLRAPGPDQRPQIRRELPTEYGETCLSVLVRDANWLFMYWEIAPSMREKLGIARGNHREQIVLRLHDMTAVSGNDVRAAVSHFDVMVTDQTSSWYVQVPVHGRRYIVELGVARGDGSFDVIARSNAVQMPRMEISDELNWKMDESFSEAHFQILQLSGGGTDVIGRLGASEGLVSSLQSRLFPEGAGFSASLFSGSLFSGEFASGSVGRQVFAGKDRQFWLVVDAEVIVYGATEPDARVKFMGREIKLNPDGTFGIRMALPDTSIEFPVEATSADGEETRRVCPVVTRETR